LNSQIPDPINPTDATKEQWRNAFVAKAISDVGMRRASNQDSYCITLADDRDKWERSGHLLIVADGMGAHAAGELASRLSVEHIPHHYTKLNRGDPVRAILQALEETNSEIYRRGQANPEFRSMGTTTSALLILPAGAVAAHVGDSRVYRLRGQTLEQLTFDHSLVWEMRASGEVSEEALKNNVVPKNVITRSLGPSASVQVDLEGPFPVLKGDRFLLCSDGLSGQLSDEEIGILLGTLDIDMAMRTMVDLANMRGGPDNITVVVGEVTSGDIATLNGAPPPAAPNPSAYPILFGVIAAICVLASLILLISHHFPFAAISLAAAVVAAISGWIKMQATSEPQGDRSSKLGRGPHRKAICKPSLAFIDTLNTQIEELQEWVADRGVQVDQKSLEASMTAGKAATASRDYKQAIYHYCNVFTDLTRHAREKGDAKDDESIDY
jgi:serine/threonine protein phosphatase PrpC